MGTNGTVLRLVGFDLLWEVPWYDEPPDWAIGSSTGPASLDMHIAAWLKACYDSGVAGNVQSIAKEIREKVQMLLYADWMPEGSKLGVYTQSEETEMLEAETEALKNVGPAES